MARLKSIVIFVFLIGNLLSLQGCQTPAAKDFARIKAGMDKGDVLDIMGDPQRKMRRKGVDEWTYIYYDKDVRTENEVHFSEGVSTYVGPHVPPAVSAEERDRRNEIENREIDKRLAERRAEARESLHRYEQENREDVSTPLPQYEPLK